MIEPAKPYDGQTTMDDEILRLDVARVELSNSLREVIALLANRDQTPTSEKVINDAKEKLRRFSR